MCLTCHAPKTAVYFPLRAPEMQIAACFDFHCSIERRAVIPHRVSLLFVLLIIWVPFTRSREPFVPVRWRGLEEGGEGWFRCDKRRMFRYPYRHRLRKSSEGLEVTQRVGNNVVM